MRRLLYNLRVLVQEVAAIRTSDLFVNFRGFGS